LDPSPLGPKQASMAPSTAAIPAFVANAPSYGAGEPYVRMSSATGKAGDEVSLSVSLENNPGITGYGITLFYDNSKLTYVSSGAGEVMSEMFHAVQAFFPITDNRYITFTSTDYIGNVDMGRVLFTVKFRINEGTAEGAISGDDLKLGYFHLYDDFALSSAHVARFPIEQGGIVVEPAVVIPITSIQINANAVTNVERGGRYRFKVTMNNAVLDDEIPWTVSNPAYATVNSEGVVTILNKKGTVVLAANDPASGLNHSLVLRIK